MSISDLRLWCNQCHVVPCEWWHVSPYFGSLWPLKKLNILEHVRRTSTSWWHHTPHGFIGTNGIPPRGPLEEREKARLPLVFRWISLLVVIGPPQCFNTNISQLTISQHFRVFTPMMHRFANMTDRWSLINDIDLLLRCSLEPLIIDLRY